MNIPLHGPLADSCTTCNVGPGELCLDGMGKEVRWFHHARIHATEDLRPPSRPAPVDKLPVSKEPIKIGDFVLTRTNRRYRVHDILDGPDPVAALAPAPLPDQNNPRRAVRAPVRLLRRTE